MSKIKKISVIIAGIMFCIALGLALYSWIHSKTIYPSSILIIFVTLSLFLNLLNMKEVEGYENDELNNHIKTHSARISYIVLTIIAGLILFISEGVFNTNQIENIPLLIVVGLTLVVQPITEFLYSRKFK